MKLDRKDPPRRFGAGGRTMADCGAIALDPGEQVTFTTPDGGECDFARTAWGFYATPSLNDRLPRFGLRGALVRNADAKQFVVLVENGHEDEFGAYLDEQQMTVVAWLDDAVSESGQAG